MRWLIGGVLVSVVVAVAAWHYTGTRQAWSGAQVSTAASGPAPVTVEAAPVRLAKVQREIEAVGSLRSNESVIVRPEIAGRITDLFRGRPAGPRSAAVPARRHVARAQLEQAKASLSEPLNHERCRTASARRQHAARPRRAVAKLRADEAALGWPGDTRQGKDFRTFEHRRPAPGSVGTTSIPDRTW